MFLDVDGTLLEIEERPEAVRSDSELNALLERLFEGLDGAMSLISGRQVADLDRIFAPLRFPAAGAHGAELRISANGPVEAATTVLPAPIIARLEALVAANSGLLLEKKRAGVSLHYRRAPQLEQTCKQLVQSLTAEIERDFRLIAGKMVFELAPRACDKGVAVEQMMRRAPFDGRCPVFVGDDVTDEDGFVKTNQLHGISVRVGEQGGSNAKYVLPDVAAVRGWLEAIAEQVAP